VPTFIYKNNKILMYLIHNYAQVSSRLDRLQAAESIHLQKTANTRQALGLDSKMRSR
jgi:hypothetical protein